MGGYHNRAYRYRRNMWNAFIIGLAVLNAVASLPAKSWNEDIEIVGGHEIDIKQAPYQVHLPELLCGGSIISENYVLTAAHCVRDGATYNIRAGSSNRSSGGVLVKGKAKLHPKFGGPRRHDYDVALLKLETPLELTDRTKVIQMADKDYKVPDGDLTVATGWGRTYVDQLNAPEILRLVEVPVVNHELCRKAYDKSGRDDVTERMLCAGKSNKDACQGDSGGPLVHKNVLVGVTSWGYLCGEPGFPGVYANVAALRQWIDENMK